MELDAAVGADDGVVSWRELLDTDKGRARGQTGPAREDLIEGKRIVLLSVGDSPERKGAPVFFEAARRFDDPTLQFVLLCSDQEFLARSRVPSNVLVLPSLDRSAFYALLRVAAVAVFPSQFESFSIATHEAMLLGRHIIVSSHVPLDGLAASYPARRIVDQDADSLAEAITCSRRCVMWAGGTLNIARPLRRWPGEKDWRCECWIST